MSVIWMAKLRGISVTILSEFIHEYVIKVVAKNAIKLYRISSKFFSIKSGELYST
ncbi:hypothetical protein AHMF7616_00815 [Adhaeribacter pallidiroseus]|uniref:Uncharacterized protein n=1 Tax=Adhaeribacter pallidiroseus TaxID=2072847 RepID=A0A369QBZ2_9BACT|nr:hypothetical protein AHMF7616_00815 [Adhaeribacter pallidiroseus]